jgi:hypothetical protein
MIPYLRLISESKPRKSVNSSKCNDYRKFPYPTTNFSRQLVALNCQRLSGSPARCGHTVSRNWKLFPLTLLESKGERLELFQKWLNAAVKLVANTDVLHLKFELELELDNNNNARFIRIKLRMNKNPCLLEKLIQ